MEAAKAAREGSEDSAAGAVAAAAAAAAAAAWAETEAAEAAEAAAVVAAARRGPCQSALCRALPLSAEGSLWLGRPRTNFFRGFFFLPDKDFFPKCP